MTPGRYRLSVRFARERNRKCPLEFAPMNPSFFSLGRRSPSRRWAPGTSSSVPLARRRADAHAQRTQSPMGLSPTSQSRLGRAAGRVTPLAALCLSSKGERRTCPPSPQEKIDLTPRTTFALNAVYVVGLQENPHIKTMRNMGSNFQRNLTCFPVSPSRAGVSAHHKPGLVRTVRACSVPICFTDSLQGKTQNCENPQQYRSTNPLSSSVVFIS